VTKPVSVFGNGNVKYERRNRYTKRASLP